MTNPVDVLREVYPRLSNGDQQAVKSAVDAIKEMVSQLDDLRSSLARQLPEAPASATAKVVDPHTQMEWLITVRDPAYARLLIGELGALSKVLAGAGFIGLDAYIDQRKAERQQDNGRPLPTQAPPVAALPDQTQNALTFQAKSLAATVNAGKAYWKVKGGKFEKFGVTVWPEVLEQAGFFVDSLDVMGVYDLTQYTATYTIKEDGKPDKVIKLAKA